MTRESKLALVLGFSLMLFVLILVSDHMAARNAPVVASNIDQRPDLGVPPLPGPGSSGNEIVMQGEDGTKALPPAKPPVVEPSGAGQGGDTRIADGGAPAGPRDQPPAPLPPTPSVKTYTIKAGDTFASIAAREYKKRSLGGKLAEYNGIDPSKMKVGVTVKLPPIVDLDPSAATRLAADDAAKAGDRAPEKAQARTTSEPTFRVYKVKAGDTLYGIAEREMGGPGRVKELRSANNEVLRGSDDLKPGMQIRIPERTSALTNASTDA